MTKVDVQPVNAARQSAAREAVIQAIADALVIAWRRDHPETALHYARS